jgi:tetratricopeptide (TPR) repeat protein
MHSSFTLVLLAVLFIPVQSPRDSIREYYEAAEAQHRAGNLLGAEAQFKLIVGEAQQRLGKTYSLQQNYPAAVEALEAARSSHLESSEFLVDLAIAYFYAGQYRKAIEPLTKVVAKEPANVAAHQMLGKTNFMIGEFEKARQELEAAFKLNPDDYDVAYTLGLSYLKLRQFAPASDVYGRMLARLGNRAALRVLIGRAYRETGFFAEAIEEFKKAVAIDPRFPRAHYHLGLAYLRKDGASRLADAKKEFKLELANHPNEFYANFHLGIVYLSEGNWTLAATHLQKASQIQPKNPDAYFLLGRSYEELKEYEKAIPVLRKAIEFNPYLGHNDYQITNAHFRLGQSLIKIGRIDEGQKELELAAELKAKAFKRDEAKLDAFLKAEGGDEQTKFPELSSAQGVVSESNLPDAAAREALKREADFYEKVIGTAYNNIAMLNVERQDFRSAAEHFRLAMKWQPQQPELNYNLGLAYYKAEQFKDAVPVLELEHRARPESLPVKDLLGMSYFMIENYSQAAQLLAEVVAARPDDVSRYYPLALSLTKVGKNEEAKTTIGQMVAKGVDSPQVHILLGQAHYNQNETTKALEELRTALSLDNKVPLAHFYSGLINIKIGKLIEAVREFEQELAINPHDLQAKYHLGFALLALQETDRGMALMREVISIDPAFANARFELGNALLKRGVVKEAIENLEAAAKLDPEKAYIHYQLGRAYLAAGKTSEGERHLEISKQIKDKERNQANPTNP